MNTRRFSSPHIISTRFEQLLVSCELYTANRSAWPIHQVLRGTLAMPVSKRMSGSRYTAESR